MRLIDRKWTDLSVGWSAVQAFQAQLEAEFGQAMQDGHDIKFRRDLSEWQKKRRVFIVLAILAPLALVGLCLAAFYFREVSCVLAWWTMTVLIILATLGVAGWSYIREMTGRGPVPVRARLEVNLAESWWNSLAPASPVKPGREANDFLALLSRSLDDGWVAVRDPITDQPAPDMDILLLGPTGAWLFAARHWQGRITRDNQGWKQHLKKEQVIPLEPAPDAFWLEQKDSLVAAMQAHLPHLAWAADLLQGGVVFSHPRVTLRKEEIRGNKAPCGPAKNWLERIRHSAADERLTLEVRLELLDLVTGLGRDGQRPEIPYASSRAEAERLYTEAAGQLRQHVEKLVG